MVFVSNKPLPSFSPFSDQCSWKPAGPNKCSTIRPRPLRLLALRVWKPSKAGRTSFGQVTPGGEICQLKPGTGWRPQNLSEARVVNFQGSQSRKRPVEQDGQKDPDDPAV